MEESKETFSTPMMVEMQTGTGKYSARLRFSSRHKNGSEISAA